MQLIDHVSITVRSLEHAKPIYLAVMSRLGARVAYEEQDAIGFGERNEPHDEVHTYLNVFESASASSDSRRHWCFRAASPEQVDAFHLAGLSAGGKSGGAPGFRDGHQVHFASSKRRFRQEPVRLVSYFSNYGDFNDAVSSRF